MADRRKIAIPISGIDTSTPDHAVADGKCETLYNLRYHDGAWRNVRPFTEKFKDLSLQDFRIIYHHPADDDNAYIATRNETVSKTIYGFLQEGYNGGGFDLWYSVDVEPQEGSPIYSDAKAEDNQVVMVPPMGYATKPFSRKFDTGVDPTTGVDSINRTCFSIVKDWNKEPAKFYAYTYQHGNETGLCALVSKSRLSAQPQHPIIGSKLYKINTTDEEDLSFRAELLGTITDLEQLDISYGEGADGQGFWNVGVDDGAVYSLYLTSEQLDDNYMALSYNTKILDDNVIAPWVYYRDYDNDNKVFTFSGEVISRITIDANGVTTLADHVTETPILHSNWDLTHFGKVLIVRDHENKKLLPYLLSNNKYTPLDIEHLGVDLSYTIDDTPNGLNKSWLPSPQWGIDSERETACWTEAITNEAGEFVLQLVDGEFWRGELALFAALRDESGAVIATSPIKIINTFQFRDDFDIVAAQENSNSTSTQYRSTATDNCIIGSKGWNIETSGGTPTIEELFATYFRWKHYGVSTGWNGPEDIINNVDKGMVYNRLYIPTINISINPETRRLFSLLKCDIAIYSTRLYSPLDSTKFSRRRLKNPIGFSSRISETELLKDYFADNKIIEQPFFLMKTITNGELLESNSSSFELKANLVQNLEQAVVYEPAIKLSDIYTSNNVEVNNRLHLLGVTSRISTNNNSFNFTSEASRIANIIVRHYDSQELRYSIHSAKSYSKVYPYQDTIINGFSLSQPFFLCLNRSSAERLYFVGDKYEEQSANTYPVYKQFALTRADAIDMAYYINRGEQDHPYADIKIVATKEENLEVEDFTTLIKDPNRIQVSELNNCFSFRYANSYRVGDANNSIITANSGAIELSDAKFGEFPLFVFTNDGIYALQSGTNNVYASVVPISFDKAITPTTLAVKSSVLFFTEMGLVGISNSGSKLLSNEILLKGDMPEWINHAKLVYMPQFDEVLIINTNNYSGYLLSLNNGMFSNRHIPSGYIINNDELIDTHNGKIYNLREEESELTSPIGYSIATRPIKLGSMELKRAETIIVRFESATTQNIHVDIEGSINTQDWITLRDEDFQTNKDMLIRRTPCSVKYLRFIISGAATDDICILAFELEYYNRMRHRMR